VILCHRVGAHCGGGVCKHWRRVGLSGATCWWLGMGSVNQMRPGCRVGITGWMFSGI